jgi:hypothetical protein
MTNRINVSHHKRLQRGEGESSLIMTVLAGAIAISLVYFGVQWVLKIKEERGKIGQMKEVQKPAPKSMEDVGGYEVEVNPIL